MKYTETKLMSMENEPQEMFVDNSNIEIVRNYNYSGHDIILEKKAINNDPQRS